MRETPGIFRLAWDLAQLPYFFILTVLLRVLFPIAKSSSLMWVPFRNWALKAHTERERIAYLVVSDMKEISPEAYRSASFWFRR